MLQVRKLILTAAAVTSMASGLAHALGLGEVSIKSALNEPLLAEIELVDAKGLTAEQIRSQLASVADFQRSGVDRSFFLTNLKFTPVVRSDGKSFVRVTSHQAVREPYLSFMMEVYWPTGRMLKEYTLLFDPPMYSPQKLVYTEAPAARPAAPAVAVQTTAVRPAATPALQGNQYRVQKNDTLWKIAERVGAGRGSVHQTMLAIQDLNPHAFIGGNINKLKSGQLLNLPSAEQVGTRNRGQAVAEFQSQVEAWRSGAGKLQTNVRPRDVVAPPARVEPGDRLRLVDEEVDESEVLSNMEADNRKLSERLVLAKEQLDSARTQNRELSSHIDELAQEVDRSEAAVAPERAEQGDRLRPVEHADALSPGGDSGTVKRDLRIHLDAGHIKDLSSRVDELGSQVEQLQRLLEQLARCLYQDPDADHPAEQGCTFGE